MDGCGGLTDTRVHGGSSGEDNVSVEVLSDVEVALHDRVVRGLVDTGRLESEERRLEEGLGRSESLVSDGDDLSVRELVRLLELGRLRGGLHLLLKVEGDVAELLLDVSDNLPLGGGGERVASLHEDLDQVVGQVSAGKVESRDGVGESEPLVDGDGVGDSVSGVEHDTGGSSGSVEREDGLEQEGRTGG